MTLTVKTLPPLRDRMYVSDVADYLSAPKGSVWRWLRRGVVDQDGHRRRIDHWRIGVRILTTRAAVDRWLAALDGDAADAVSEVVR